MLIAGAGLTQGVANNCFIPTVSIGGQDSARYLVGRIFRQGTGGRANPPLCLSGFGTAGTPFALGHVMALELGGPDIPANIVPQYGQWQGNVLGAWRAMETRVGEAVADADVFIVDIVYGAGPFVTTHQDQLDRFTNGDKLFHWTEARIPVRFRVWTVAAGWAIGTVSVANYFAANDAGKEAAIAGLIAALPDTRKVFDETIDSMPQIDRQYWRGQMINVFARREYLIYTRGIKSQNQKAETHYQSKLAEFTKKTGISRTSPRASVKSHGPTPPKEVVPLGMAQWLSDDDVVTKVHDNMVGTPNAVSGWTPVELANFTPQQVRAAVFAN